MANFLIQFLKHPRSIGAIAPSSRFLAAKMMEPIDFAAAACIVEYGPGSGAFTRELVRRKRPATALILVEQNPAFAGPLRARYGAEPNVHVIQGSAADVMDLLTQHGFDRADYIVSGLPFTSLPPELSAQILTATQEALGAEGTFITFQYSMVKKALFARYFTLADTRWEPRNLPPAHTLVLKMKK
ncbi:MAG: SAM-dependent methyltransferase [Oscillospiraceae bacterium]|nr:SAM-dependent methyltransferase [Oscillospiraceae bacterium]